MLPELPADDEMRISTRRLDLVKLTAGDAEDLFPLLKDQAFARFTGGTPPRDTLAVPSIVGSIHPDNIASQIAAQRIGLRPTGRLHEGEVVCDYVPPE